MTKYTAEQINEAFWDLHRNDKIAWRESLSDEQVERIRNRGFYGTSGESRLNVDSYRRPYSELSYSERMEFPGYGGWDAAAYGGGVLAINGESVPFEHIDNDDAEFMSRVKITIQVGDQYFVKEGTHISHDGTYWDGDVYEATPRKVTSTEWDRK